MACPPRVRAHRRPLCRSRDERHADDPRRRRAQALRHLEVLKGVSFDVHRGNVVSMIGASGSGKSTLLRCINYLEVADRGRHLHRRRVARAIAATRSGARKPRPLSEINRIRRELGIVFQQFNLWPHMTVLGNVIEAPHARARPVAQGGGGARRGVPAPRAPARQGAASTRRACPAASSSASRSPARSRCSPR